MGRTKEPNLIVKRYIESNLDNKEGWTVPALAKELGISVHTTRYVLQMLDGQGLLIRIDDPFRKQRQAKTTYYVRKLYEKEKPKNWTLESTIDVHNVFRPPHCGGRG